VTFDEIVSEVKSRLNLTSTEATTRVGQFVNSRYRRLTSSVGVQTSRRTTSTANTVAGNPRVTFSLEKVERVYLTASGKARVLSERSYDEWRTSVVHAPSSGDPLTYAIETTGASTVTIVLDPTPSGTETLSADGLQNASTLSGSSVPNFPADFHDALVFGAMADELRKMEKPDLAAEAEAQYEARVADLRYFLAKSGYLSITQGPRSGLTRGAYRSGYKWGWWR
jgi:hypothetical protein